MIIRCLFEKDLEHDSVEVIIESLGVITITKDRVFVEGIDDHKPNVLETKALFERV